MTFVCSVCGKTHEGLQAWVFGRPDHWVNLSEAERTQGKANDDLCMTGDGHFYVRSVLRFPLIGGPEDTFEFGVWGSLSEANFWRYVESFDDADQSKLGGMFSFLSNEIREFPGSSDLHADLWPQDDNQRPLMHLQDADHPLVYAQRNGIQFEDVLAIIHPKTGDAT